MTAHKQQSLNKHLGSSLQEAIQDFTRDDVEAQELMAKQKIINDICTAILEARQSKGMSQVELANKLETKQTAISRIERGNSHRLPSLEFLFKIAKALDKDLVIEWK